MQKLCTVKELKIAEHAKQLTETGLTSKGILKLSCHGKVGSHLRTNGMGTRVLSWAAGNVILHRGAGGEGRLHHCHMKHPVK